MIIAILYELRKIYLRAGNSKLQQEKMETTINELNDSLRKVTSIHQKLKEEQTQKDAKRQRVENAITRGKAEIDRTMKNTGIMHHYDTLSNFIYFRSDIFNRINEGATASKQYTDSISKDFTENEMAEIINALTVHLGKIQEQYIKRYNKIKEAYDKSVTKGH